METQVTYFDVAQQACVFEREHKWLQAFEHWKQATEYPTKKVNQNWAKNRAQYCSVRAGYPLNRERNISREEKGDDTRIILDLRN